MAQAKTVAATAGIGGAGLMAGFAISPETGLAILKWLGGSVGPVGLIAVVTLGAGISISVTFNWIMWNRLKEKDQECQQEMERAENRWSIRFAELRGDLKEAFKTVAVLSEQTTLLVERSRTNTPTRAS